jgi:hypothetical protein
MSKKKEDNTELNSEKEKENEIPQRSSQSSVSPSMADIFDSKDPATIQRRISTEMTSLMMASGPAPNPIFSKMNEAHIDKFLDIIDGDGKRKYEYKKGSRNYQVFYTILGTAVFIFMLVYFSSDAELLKSILSHLAALIAGGFGGSGITKRLKKKV